MDFEKQSRSETEKQAEVDADIEYLSVEKHLKQKLQKVLDENLRFKGENGIIRKKFASAYKDIEDAKNQIVRLTNDNKRIENIISSLEEDVLSLKKDVQNRDEYIQEKEKKIFEMKRGNQVHMHIKIVDRRNLKNTNLCWIIVLRS